MLISAVAFLVKELRTRRPILWMWIGIALVSGLAADTMMPEAFEHGGVLVGVVTTLGFVVAFTIHQLD